MNPEFYQQHLNRVSRSFAFCIAELSSPFREWVGLSYLLFRILDTVEDSPWTDWKQQDQHFADLHRFLEERPSPSDVQRWAFLFPESIPEGEKVLLADSAVFFDDYHHLKPEIRLAIQSSVEKMNLGMKHFSHTRKQGVLRLSDLKEVNQYCFCVAGLVGELLSDLYLAYDPTFKAPPNFYANSYRFGLFLQKMNLLKDQMGDELEGRFLIHNRPEVLESLRQDADGAMAYVLSLPESERGFRTFCSWSLFLGLASIPFMEEAYESKKPIKISREMTQELLKDVAGLVGENGKLRELFDDAASILPLVSSETRAGQGSSCDQWFIKIASSPGLNETLMRELGFLS